MSQPEVLDLDDQRLYLRGHLVGHSSNGDDADVGISVGLDGKTMLFAGEIPRATGWAICVYGLRQTASYDVALHVEPYLAARFVQAIAKALEAAEAPVARVKPSMAGGISSHVPGGAHNLHLIYDKGWGHWTIRQTGASWRDQQSVTEIGPRAAKSLGAMLIAGARYDLAHVSVSLEAQLYAAEALARDLRTEIAERREGNQETPFIRGEIHLLAAGLLRVREVTE